jgi:glc operon protein GlcG
MAVTVAEANRIVQASTAKAAELNVKLSVAVCDTSGNLLAFNRMDGSISISIHGAQGKAAAVAALGRPSAELADLAQSPIFSTLNAMSGGRMIPAQGGLPIFRSGELIGAVGGSSGTSQEDEDCVRAGLAAL